MVKVPRDLPEYYYSELPDDSPHIRLLKLEPGKHEDYIHVHLFPLNLREAHKKYECISYVWGDSTEVRRIIVDGHWFSVTLNLFLALQHFRHEKEERTLWADAICIHQTNPPEKGRQVQLMGKIYENSLRTLVWLGLDTDGTAIETTDFIKNTSWIARALVDKFGSVTKIPALSRHDNPISQTVDKWKLFENLLHFVWFTRVWVMQEVGIAPDVVMHWGNADLRFSDLITVNEFMRHVPQLFEYLPFSRYLHDAFIGLLLWYGNKDTWRDQIIPDLLHQDAIAVPHPNMIDCLIQSSRRDVTDLRDHIYALLGHPLARVEGDTIVQADYTRHVDDVFTEVSSKLLQDVDPTLALSVVGDMGKKRPRDLNDKNQPTWVARWELRLQTNNIGRPGQWFYAGGKDTKPDIKIDAKAKTLITAAVVFEKIKWVSKPIPIEDITLDTIGSSGRAAMEWVWDALPAEPCRYDGDQGRRDAFTLSLTTGVYQTNLRAEDDLDTHRRLSKAYLEFIKSLRGQSSFSEAVLRADAREWENDFKWTGLNRPFIVTERGFYGLGPSLTEVGDVVAVLPGFNVPYVLRPAGEANSYKLVGASFVQGVMAGDIMNESDPLKLGAGTPREITIV